MSSAPFFANAAEKVCKAHLIATQGYDSFQFTHTCIHNNLPTIAKVLLAKEKSGKTHGWQVAQITKVARQIELLSPNARDGGSREDNCEYPWKDGNEVVQTPCQFKFPDLHDGDRTMVLLIRLMRKAANDLL